MPNQQLIEYIKQATEQGQSREQIKATLLGAGWQEVDIEMAFGGNVASIPTPKPAPAFIPSSPMQSFGGGQTAQTNTPQVTYGGFWIRYLAFMLDNFIFSLIVLIPMVAIMFVVFLAIGEQSKSSAGYIILMAGVSILPIVLRFGYFIVLTHKKQATFGKSLLGLKVVSVDGSKLSLGKIILRETIGKIVSTLILSMGHIMVAFTSKKQGLHDKFAGSVVISNPAERKTWAMVVAIIFATVLPAVVILGILATVTLASLNNAREKGADAAIKANLANIRATAEMSYDMNGGYGNMLSDSSVANSLRAAETSAGAKAVTNVTETAYAIYLPLKHPSPPATGWCVDSTGFSQQSVNPGTSTSCSPNREVKIPTTLEKKHCGSMSTTNFGKVLLSSDKLSSLSLPQQEKESLTCISQAFSECGTASFSLISPPKGVEVKNSQSGFSDNSAESSNFEINKDRDGKSCIVKVTSLDKPSLPPSSCKFSLNTVTSLKFEASQKKTSQYLFAPVVMMIGMAEQGIKLTDKSGNTAGIECK